MGCGCGSAKKRVFEHIAKDGTRTEVQTQAEAVQKVREDGGTWQVKNK